MPILFILFTVVPILELVVLIKVGSAIGAFPTILLVVLISVTGAWLARVQGFLVLQKIESTINQGIMPTEEMLDGMMILAGGILLLTPGFISDIIGLVMLFPATRWLVKQLTRKYIQMMLKNGQVVTFSQFSGRKDNDVIDI